MKNMKTIAEQLNVKDFPFEIFDKNGNRIYYEDSWGYWSKTEYDSEGNEIHYENSNGYWYKKEYDSEGNMIYFENSCGYWFKSEFDSEGNKIYHENPNGVIEDNRKIPEYTMEELVKKLGNFKIKK